MAWRVVKDAMRCAQSIAMSAHRHKPLLPIDSELSRQLEDSILARRDALDVKEQIRFIADAEYQRWLGKKWKTWDHEDEEAMREVPPEHRDWIWREIIAPRKQARREYGEQQARKYETRMAEAYRWWKRQEFQKVQEGRRVRRRREGHGIIDSSGSSSGGWDLPRSGAT